MSSGLGKKLKRFFQVRRKGSFDRKKFAGLDSKRHLRRSSNMVLAAVNSDETLKESLS